MGWDEGRGLRRKQLKSPEERTQGNRLYKKTGDEGERDPPEKKVSDGLPGNGWREEERQGRMLKRSKWQTT